MGEINAIRKYDGKWYILDNKQKTAIVAFDSVGQPVSLYDKTGNGKGEYAEITGFDVSPETGDIYPDGTPRYEDTCIYAILNKEWTEQREQKPNSLGLCRVVTDMHEMNEKKQ